MNSSFLILQLYEQLKQLSSVRHIPRTPTQLTTADNGQWKGWRMRTAKRALSAPSPPLSCSRQRQKVSRIRIPKRGRSEGKASGRLEMANVPRQAERGNDL